jgi:signal transduction histidine kinase
MCENGSRRRSLHLTSRCAKSVVIVSVRDSGKGMDPDDARRLFEPFYTTKPTGTGMGLTISRSIIESHGGSLWAVRNVNGGATFRFKIPLLDPSRPHS